MKRLLAMLFLGLGLATGLCRADDVPELKAIEIKYDQTQFPHDEALRQKYVMELAVLRWDLARQNKPGWKEVDAEIARHPAPADSDGMAFAKALAGTWHSPRHDYLFKADSTWVMDPDPSVSNPTHGTWSIQGNQFTMTVAVTPVKQATYVIVLLNADNLIYTDTSTAMTFYEKRSLQGGLPLRRDE